MLKRKVVSVRFQVGLGLLKEIKKIKKTNKMKKLIILSIILLTTLSATLLGSFSETTKKQEVTSPKPESSFEKDLAFTKKLKLFNAKDYLKDYERKKKAKEMLDESMKRMELTHTK